MDATNSPPTTNENRSWLNWLNDPKFAIPAIAIFSGAAISIFNGDNARNTILRACVGGVSGAVVNKVLTTDRTVRPHTDNLQTLSVSEHQETSSTEIEYSINEESSWQTNTQETNAVGALKLLTGIDIIHKHTPISGSEGSVFFTKDDNGKKYVIKVFPPKNSQIVMQTLTKGEILALYGENHDNMALLKNEWVTVYIYPPY